MLQGSAVQAAMHAELPRGQGERGPLVELALSEGRCSPPPPGPARCLTQPAPAGIERRLELVRSVAESIELVHTHEAGAFLASFFAPFLRLLQMTAPAFQEGPVQQLRSTVLSALSRWAPGPPAPSRLPWPGLGSSRAAA